MKHLCLLLFLLLQVSMTQAQQTIEDTIMYDGRMRSFILYVPESYQADVPAPLVLNFHGYTSNNLEQMFYGDFRPIADTAGFLIVHPMGTVDLLGNTHWNVGWGSSTVDDVGFTNALLDTLSAAYNINQDRIYSTGMSNGGFMSYRLACELSNRIAAIASVTGAMTINTPSTCSPEHPMPVMEIHGTSDGTVPYNGNILFESVASAMSYWTNFNETDATPVITDIDDSDPNDGSTVQHYFYGNGNNDVEVEHYKVNNGAHTWPGTAFTSPGTNHDINASKEIWRFFSTFDIHGKIKTTSTAPVLSAESVSLYPNPTRSSIVIEQENERSQPYVITTLCGQTVLSGILSSGKQEIAVHHLPVGMYVFITGNNVNRFFKAE